MALGWGIGLGVVGSVGSSLLGASSRNKAARKAAQNQQRQLDAQHEAQQVAYQNQVFSTTYGNKLREIQANDYNERIVAGYKQRIEEVKEQFGWNNQAAGQAYANNQWWMNEKFQQALLNKWDVIENLSIAEGFARASGTGSVNKSAERANLVNTLRQDKSWLIDKGLKSAREQMRQKSLKIASAHMTQDKAAYATIAVPPELRTPGLEPIAFKPPAPAARLSIPSGGLGAGDFFAAGMSGLSTFADLGMKGGLFRGTQNIPKTTTNSMLGMSTDQLVARDVATYGNTVPAGSFGISTINR